MAEGFVSKGDCVEVDVETAPDGVLQNLLPGRSYTVVKTLGMLATLDNGYSCNCWYLTKLRTTASKS